MHKGKIAARWMLCLISAASLVACGAPIRIAKPPADKLRCAALPDVPKLTPLDWSKVQTVDDAKALVFAREGETAGYIVNLRGAWFSCSSVVAWHRDYNAALPD